MGLPGVLVFLDFNNNGVRDANETQKATDPDGNYVFAGLGPGVYQVVAISPAERQQTFPIKNQLDVAGQVRTGDRPQSVIFADFNGDTYLDLAVTNEGAGSVSILFNDSQGGFPSGRDFLTGKGALWAASGDLNRDGHLDLVVANRIDKNISVLLNDGTGM